MSCSACLVLSPPEYEEPPRTPPFLVASEALPDLRQVIQIKEENAVREFGGAVMSQDNGADVQLRLYIDYGRLNVALQPYQVVAAKASIPAGTLADEARSITGMKWYLQLAPVSTGCHTVTMMASHAFNDDDCPSDLEDSSYLVWHVVKCDPSQAECSTECPPLCQNQQCVSCGSPLPDAGVEGGSP